MILQTSNPETSIREGNSDCVRQRTCCQGEITECIVNLVDGEIWDLEAAGSIPVTQTFYCRSVMDTHKTSNLVYAGSSPVGNA